MVYCIRVNLSLKKSSRTQDSVGPKFAYHGSANYVRSDCVNAISEVFTVFVDIDSSKVAFTQFG